MSVCEKRMRRRPLLPAAAVLVGCLLIVDGYSPSNHGGSARRSRSCMDSAGTVPTRESAAATSPSLTMVQQYSDIEESFEQNVDETFELQVGRALDALRSDYPEILTTDPDFSIYSPDLTFIDPSGVQLNGLRNYKASFALVHALIRVIYCPRKSGITFRMCYDKARQNIRIHWNVEVVPREIFGGSRTTAHVDGISVYELNLNSGNITQHRVEKLLFNNRPVMPEEGVIARLRKEHTVTVPSFIDDKMKENYVVRFQSHSPMRCRSSLFALEAVSDEDPSSYPDLDWEALELKNKSRKKFGLKALTPEEFLELEAEVQQMAASQQQQQSTTTTVPEKTKEPSFLDKMLGGVLKDTCESNFDCQRPEVCCDFGFTKRCCSSGSPVLQRQLVPIPVENYPPGEAPWDKAQRNYY